MLWHEMPGKVNSYVKQRVMAVREMNGGLHATAHRACGSGRLRDASARFHSLDSTEGFFLSVSKHLLFINRRCSA